MCAYLHTDVHIIHNTYTARTTQNHMKQVFRAFDLCKFEDLRVVIIGQDPYHNIGQAEGLCFSVPKGIAIPSSLRNIYKVGVCECAHLNTRTHI